MEGRKVVDGIEIKPALVRRCATPRVSPDVNQSIKNLKAVILLFLLFGEKTSTKCIINGILSDGIKTASR